MKLSVITDWSYLGLRAVVLENQFLRAVVLPEAGAKIWQITYKPHDADLLWEQSANRARSLARKLSL